jgi:prepilin-type N-terminal cleavage/methylation domain-containing protein
MIWLNPPKSPSSAEQGRRAFTLLELLIVIGVIAILASISIPAIKGITQSNLLAAANRQLLDDLAFARLKALNERTTVYVVFIPPSIFQRLALESNPKERRYITNLVSGQYTSYALLASRTVGDQPGQATPHYITEWKALPEGMLIAPYKFTNAPPPELVRLGINEYLRPFAYEGALPFPNSRSARLAEFRLPYIAFNAQGQLTSERDEIIPLARGSIFYPKNASGQYTTAPADVQLTPPNQEFQFVRINWLTGRAKVEVPEFD